MKQPNIIFVGHVVIDHNKVEQTSYVRWGSPAMFMLRYFRTKFAFDATIIASYGQDFLHYAGDVLLLPKAPNLEHTIIYENIVTNGHRTQYCHGKDAPLPDLTPSVLQTLSKADIIFLAPLTPAFTAEYVEKLMGAAPSGCLKVLLPQGYLRLINDDDLVSPREFSEAGNIMPHFDLVILSDEDHPRADIVTREWKQQSPNTNIIVTRNAEGADIILPEGVERVPTQAIPLDKIVDSVGLGDVFGAATAYHLWQFGNLVAAVKEGNAAALEKLLTPRVI